MVGWLGRVVAWLVILGIGAVITITVLIPRITGATPYVVLTGSMTPELPPGTMVVVKPVEAGEVRIGDVITYQLKSGEPAVVTHRVIGTGTHHGEPILRTKGDANDIADKEWVRPVQVRGVKWYAVPYLGYLTSSLTAGQRQLGLYAIVALLVGFAVYMFSSAARDHVRNHAASGREGEAP